MYVYVWQCSKLRVHTAGRRWVINVCMYVCRDGVHDLAAGCTHIGTFAPSECTLFHSIYIHYIL